MTELHTVTKISIKILKIYNRIDNPLRCLVGKNIMTELISIIRARSNIGSIYTSSSIPKYLTNKDCCDVQTVNFISLVIYEHRVMQ